MFITTKLVNIILRIEIVGSPYVAWLAALGVNVPSTFRNAVSRTHGNALSALKRHVALHHQTQSLRTLPYSEPKPNLVSFGGVVLALHNGDRVSNF